MKKHNALLTFAMLAAAVLVLLKVAIYSTQSIHYKFNPIYTFGTFGVLLVSVLQFYNHLYKQQRIWKFWVLVPKAVLLITIAVAFSYLVDQIAYTLNPSFVAAVKQLSIDKSEAANKIIKSKVMEQNIQLLKETSNVHYQGFSAFIRDVANAIFMNTIWILPFTLIYNLLKNRKA